LRPGIGVNPPEQIKQQIRIAIIDALEQAGVHPFVEIAEMRQAFTALR
jgi:hypothetical protein